jgi:Raf kinase inhibitor-like YbhB/YbcL family protein
MKNLFDILIFSALVLAVKDVSGQSSGLQITSTAFGHNQMIPREYTCQGEDVNPSLEIRGIPPAAKGLALIMDDPDAPMGTWDHWLVYNIPLLEKIERNSIPGTQVKNSFGKFNYGGPCPPSGTHRYFFKLYALDTAPTLPPTVSKKTLEKAMEGHVLERAELVGLYKKTP